MKNRFLIPLVVILFNLTSYAQKTVVIGTQTWTTENLDVSKFRNGDKIPQAKTRAEWDTYALAKEAAWCYSSYSEDNGKKYGKYYNWYAVSDTRGLAPMGYHVASVDEWTTIIEFLGGTSIAGVKLKSKDGWQDNGNGTNSSGFSAIPTSAGSGQYASFWSSTEFEEMDVNVEFLRAWFFRLEWFSGELQPEPVTKNGAGTVRCIKD